MKKLQYIALVITVLLLTSCAGRDQHYENMTDAEREMHFKTINELKPAAGYNSQLEELMKPRLSVLDFLELE